MEGGTTMVIPITKAQSKQVNKLVRLLCCNCCNDNCLLLDDGETHRCVQLISFSGIYCNYLKNSVLPADKKLFNEIMGANNGSCKQCGKSFYKTSAKTKYCEDCAKQRHRKQKTLSEQKRRQKVM